VVSKVKFNLQTDVTGMEELSRLINRVDALEKRMQSYAGRTVPAAAKASQKFAGQLQVQSKAARRAQLGAQQFGMQINDLSTSITTGANPMIAMNQQLGQIGFALGQMQGPLKKVGLILGGVWGAGIGLAGMALYNMLQTTEDAEEAVTQLGQSFEFAALSADEQRKVQELLIESNRQIERTGYSAAEATRFQAMEAVKLAKANIEVLRTSLERAEQDRNLSGPRGAAALAGAESLPGIIEEAEGKLGKLENALSGATLKTSRLWQEMSEAQRANQEYTQSLEDLEYMVKQGIVPQAEAIALQKDLIESRDRATEAIEKATKATKGATRAAKQLSSAEANLAGVKKLVEIRAEILVNKYRAGAISAEEFMSANYGLSASLRNAEEAAKPAAKQMETIAKRIDRVNKEARAAKKAVEEFLEAGREPIEGPVEEFDLPQMLTDERIKQSVEGFKAIQQAAQNVGRAVSDSFARMLSGASSWKDGMRGIIRAVIDQLWQLYVVQQIVGFITSAIGGLGLPSPGASPMGSTASGIGGFRERGGPVQAGTAYVVGEKRPELFIPGTSGTIVPNTDAMSGGGGAVINVDARGATDPEAVRMQVERGILEAAPQIIAASEARTIRTLRRPRLAGGSF